MVSIPMKADYKKIITGHLVCCFVHEGEKPPKELVPHKTNFEGKQGQTYCFDNGKLHVLAVGLGKKEEFRPDDLRKAGGLCVKYAGKLRESEFSVYLPGSDDNAAQTVTEGALLAAYAFDELKKKEDDFSVKLMHIVAGKNVSAGVKKGEIYANAQNYSRRLDETPANIATPMMIAREAKKLARERGFVATVYDAKDMKKMGMNSILAVAQGSAQPPALVKLEYNKGRNYPLYCIVGKGITFDSGGISLKPPKDMHEMKYDKSGAMNVLGIFKAASELKLPIRLLGLMPLTENTPDGNAQKPGDIIRAYNGKTIEVLNTDAEGRLVLADALSYAAEQKPDFIIDMATLTGAMVVSLGRHAIGVFTDDDKLAGLLEESGVETHERVWRLPMWPEYGEMMKSDIADLKNISETPEAGSITAAAFLKEFTGESRWAHLDIASVESVHWDHAYLGKGATAMGVRLVTRALERTANKKR
jgi:leucyl aminopeptidase